MTALLYGLLALVVIFVILRVSVKLRSAAARGRGVRVYDLACDVEMPARLSARSYQIAFYLTMKSRAAEPAERPINGPVASP